MSKRKHLIIGCGPAALSALEQIRKINSEDEIKLVTMEDYPPYSPTLLPYLVSGKVDEAALPIRPAEYFEQMQATIIRGKEVVRLLPGAKEVVFKDGGRETYDTLLIASGSEPTIQPVLKEAGIPGFHIMDDYIHIKQQLKDKSRVTILGAGLVGMELAPALAEKGHEVSVIAPRERILRRYFDPESGGNIIDLFAQHNVLVTLHWGEVTEVEKHGTTIKATFASGRSIETEMLIACAGVAPRISLLKGSGIKINRGILVDWRVRTNIEDIYAAGDVAEAPDFFTGQPGMNQIVLSAVEQGKIAGSNMAGVEAEYKGWISTNVFNFFGNTAFSAGISMPTENRFQVLTERDDKQKRLKRLVYDGDTLVGAMFFNVDLDPGAILYLIEKRVDISAYKQMLFEQPREISRWLMLETERKEAT